MVELEVKNQLAEILAAIRAQTEKIRAQTEKIKRVSTNLDRVAAKLDKFAVLLATALGTSSPTPTASTRSSMGIHEAAPPSSGHYSVPIRTAELVPKLSVRCATPTTVHEISLAPAAATPLCMKGVPAPSRSVLPAPAHPVVAVLELDKGTPAMCSMPDSGDAVDDMSASTDAFNNKSTSDDTFGDSSTGADIFNDNSTSEDAVEDKGMGSDVFHDESVTVPVSWEAPSSVVSRTCSVPKLDTPAHTRCSTKKKLFTVAWGDKFLSSSVTNPLQWCSSCDDTIGSQSRSPCSLYLGGQLNVTEKQPRPWPSFTSSCGGGSQNPGRGHDVQLREAVQHAPNGRTATCVCDVYEEEQQDNEQTPGSPVRHQQIHYLEFIWDGMQSKLKPWPDGLQHQCVGGRDPAMSSPVAALCDNLVVPPSDSGQQVDVSYDQFVCANCAITNLIEWCCPYNSRVSSATKLRPFFEVWPDIQWVQRYIFLWYGSLGTVHPVLGIDLLVSSTSLVLCWFASGNQLKFKWGVIQLHGDQVGVSSAKPVQRIIIVICRGDGILQNATVLQILSVDCRLFVAAEWKRKHQMAGDSKQSGQNLHHIAQTATDHFGHQQPSLHIVQSSSQVSVEKVPWKASNNNRQLTSSNASNKYVPRRVIGEPLGVVLPFRELPTHCLDALITTSSREKDLVLLQSKASRRDEYTMVVVTSLLQPGLLIQLTSKNLLEAILGRDKRVCSPEQVPLLSWQGQSCHLSSWIPAGCAKCITKLNGRAASGLRYESDLVEWAENITKLVRRNSTQRRYGVDMGLYWSALTLSKIPEQYQYSMSIILGHKLAPEGVKLVTWLCAPWDPGGCIFQVFADDSLRASRLLRE